MIEQWFSLSLQPGPRPALVLDVSESAKPYWPVLRSLAEGVLEALPNSTAWPRIFFLGNPEPYEAAQFTAQAETWFQQNAGRGSFISPVFERLADEPETVVAVVGAGRIFDFPDWQGHPLVERAIWSSFGPNSVTDGALPEESVACDQLAERLNNPSLRVEIGGVGTMPFFWDDPAFAFTAGKLVGQKTSGTLVVGVLSPEEGMASAAVVQANGARRELPLATAEPPRWPAWTTISMGEFNLLKQCKKQQAYHCPACQQMHPFGRFRCPQQGAKPIFPTLGALPPGGFCQLDTWGWEAKLLHVPCAAMKAGAEAVAVRAPDGAARIYRFDPALNRWQPAEEFATFFKLEEKIDALVL